MTSVTDENYDPDEHEPLLEGEEAPPPLVHTMAVVRWAIFGAISLFALVMVLGYLGLNPFAAETQQAAQYNCPMHPTYISNQPGDCPICGMSLVPIKGDGTDTMSMPMEGTKSDAMSSTAKQGQFTCPMHPEVVSDSAGRCPKCNMFLVPVQEPSDPHAGHDMSGMGEAPVLGLVPVTIEPERLQLIGLRTAPVERRALGESLRLAGFVTPDETRLANLNVRTSGWVQELFVNQTGQYVEKGAPLLSVYSQDLYQAQQDYIVARDAAALASTDTLFSETRSQLLDASRDRLLLLGLSKIEIAELERSDIPSPQLVLRSPVSGYVLDKAVNRGQFITPDQPLLTIADLSRLWVLADVYERDLARIRVGQTVRAHVASFPGESIDGRASFIYPTVSENTRTLKVRFELNNVGMHLRPGMYAEVDLEPSGESALAVPSDAILDGGEIQYAFVVHEGNHFEPRVVTVGRTSDDWVEIHAGLTEGEIVVTSANFLIDSEGRLKAAIAGMGNTQPSGHEGHTQ